MYPAPGSSSIEQLSLLAVGTKMRAALRHDDALDGRAARRARLAGALVYAVANLKKSLAPLGIHVIRNRRSPGCDRLRQHCGDGFMQFACTLPLDALRQCQRM